MNDKDKMNIREAIKNLEDRRAGWREDTVQYARLSLMRAHLLRAITITEEGVD